jgi:hypothetical protein
MKIIEQFNETIDRELGRLSKEQEVSLEHVMSEFDDLVRSGIIEPERYKLEPISTISINAQLQV